MDEEPIAQQVPINAAVPAVCVLAMLDTLADRINVIEAVVVVC
jgi:hypothetical protein